MSIEVDPALITEATGLASFGVELRAANDTDIEFIVNSWLKSYRWNLHVKEIRDDDYYPGQREVILECLRVSRVAVACLEASPSVIVGWACGDSPDVDASQLDFVYVKREFRKYGIARALVVEVAGCPDDGVSTFVTHMTKSFRHWTEKHNCYRYNPYLLMR